jgi:hypothetical protein
MESDGLTVAIVEKWNPHARIRQDLFGIIDLLGVGLGGTVAVQTTSASNMSTRRKKMAASETLPKILAAGWRVELHGWQKVKGRWKVKREEFEKVFV